MGGKTQGKTYRSSFGRIPPFWIRPHDDHDQPLDPQVHALAQRMWPWAYRHVERELQDGPRAAEILEEVAIEVSARLRHESEVARNLMGYLITAFHHRVRSHVIRDRRLAYEGLVRELEENHHLRASDGAASFENELALKLLVSHLPHEIKHMLNYRMLGFSWKEIGAFLGISTKQAKSRFYYGVQRAYDALLENQAIRRSEKEHD